MTDRDVKPSKIDLGALEATARAAQQDEWARGEWYWPAEWFGEVIAKGTVRP